jgi:7 transmembrane receptor (rhodopsin family)
MSNNASNLYNVSTSATTDLGLHVGLPGNVLVTFVPLPLWSAFQWVIFVCGTAGNVFVLAILLWSRSPTHRVTQMLIASLAVANTSMMLGSAWLQARLFENYSWKYGLFWCKLFLLQSGLTMGCSTWTLAFAAVDRYFNKTNSV